MGRAGTVKYTYHNTRQQDSLDIATALLLCWVNLAHTSRMYRSAKGSRDVSPWYMRTDSAEDPIKVP